MELMADLGFFNGKEREDKMERVRKMGIKNEKLGTWTTMPWVELSSEA